MTSKEMEREAQFWHEDTESVIGSDYIFTGEELQAYKEQVCREYKESIIKYFPSHEYPDILKAIENTPTPE